LTTNTELQKYALSLLEGHKGSMILMNPQTGSIIAMADRPTFDPNTIESNWSNIIADGTAMGFGVSEEEVKQFNNNLGTTVVDAKNNKLIGIEFFTFSDDGKGFSVANFDYGKKEFNDQKKEKKEFYKKLYEAFKK